MHPTEVAHPWDAFLKRSWGTPQLPDRFPAPLLNSS